MLVEMSYEQEGFTPRIDGKCKQPSHTHNGVSVIMELQRKKYGWLQFYKIVRGTLTQHETKKYIENENKDHTTLSR